MEDHSAVDISIRKVAVRLNDSNMNSEMNGCVNSLYIPTSVENETQVTCFNEECEGKCITNHSGIANDFEEKLHICKESASSLLNGCNKLLHEDIKKIEFSKCNNLDVAYELIKTDGVTESSERTLSESSETPETERTTIEKSLEETEECSLENIDIDFTQGLMAYPGLCDNSYDITSGEDESITYLGYESESQMPDIMRLIQKDLSEPYSIYTYRYFIHNWPKLCFLAQDKDLCVGAIVCKLDAHKKLSRRGYIAMLAVDERYRKKKIGSHLVLRAIQAMERDGADEVVLETEITNRPALRLYENLGFVRDKRLFRYYLNGVDALRLKLWLK